MQKFFTALVPDKDQPILTPEIQSVQQEYMNLMSQLQEAAISIPEEVQNDISFNDWISSSDDSFWEEPSVEETSSNTSTVAQKAVDFAKQFIGYKYTWGGHSPSTGFDCSGLGYYSFAQFGIKLPRTASEMAKVGIEVPIDQVQKGDFIVTKSRGPSGHHVVWVTGVDKNGNIQVIEAKGRKWGVVESTFKNFNNIKAVRRIPDSNTQLNTKPIDRKTISFGSKANYAKTMYNYIYRALQKQGIDAATWAPILVAHTAIESGWGNDFSRRNNNFAGIKGKGSGKVSTKEYVPGKGYITIKDSFKSYPSIEAFADDFVTKLRDRFGAFNGSTSQYLSNLKRNHYFTARLEDYQKIFNPTLNQVYKYLNS